MKNVCVIGAGPSGLVTLKELLSENINVKCFESNCEIGGAFVAVNHGGQAYDSMNLTVSNYFMAYSDFMPKIGEHRRYWSAQEYCQYLLDYVEEFQLSKHIYTSHKVVSADIKGNTILVTFTNHEKVYKENFDHLVICTGLNSRPYLPNIKNNKLYKGLVIHSNKFKNASHFKNKNVICVGLGESGAEIAHEISQVANCKVLIRDYPNVIPRFINGFTNDSFTSHCFYAMKRWGINNFMKFKSLFYLNFDKSLSQEDRLIQKWISLRKNFMGKFLTKNDVFVKDVVNNKLELICDEIESFTSNGIITKNKQRIKADVVVFNTGYKTSFSNFSFESDFIDPRELFKHMIHPKYKALISLIGWARPTQGGIPACSEMQARYLALLISNKKKLPQKVQLKKVIANDKLYYQDLFTDSYNIKSLVSYHEFMISMSRLIGCNPKILHWTNLRLTRKLYFGSHISAFYRLRDPIKRNVALSTIYSLPIAYSKRRSLLIMIFTFLFNPISRIAILFLKISKRF